MIKSPITQEIMVNWSTVNAVSKNGDESYFHYDCIYSSPSCANETNEWW